LAKAGLKTLAWQIVPVPRAFPLAALAALRRAGLSCAVFLIRLHPVLNNPAHRKDCHTRDFLFPAQPVLDDSASLPKGLSCSALGQTGSLNQRTQFLVRRLAAAHFLVLLDISA
jgi:hypothetical protein